MKKHVKKNKLSLEKFKVARINKSKKRRIIGGGGDDRAITHKTQA